MGKYSDLEGMKCLLISAVKQELAKGVECVNTAEMGKVIDMIKDLSEARYYETIVEALEENERMGYKVPHRVPDEPWVDSYMVYDEPMMDMMRRGYSEKHPASAHGKTYDEYQMAKHRYEETHSEADKAAMDAHAAKHMADSMTTVREIYKNADPEMKKKIKADFSKLVGEMPV